MILVQGGNLFPTEWLGTGGARTGALLAPDQWHQQDKQCTSPSRVVCRQDVVSDQGHTAEAIYAPHIVNPAADNHVAAIKHP
jgi:hypothetical protein